MSIGIDNQFYFSISAGTKKDFLAQDDLFEFTLFEKVGNILPEYILNFRSSDKDILAYLNEGNKLTLSFGRTEATKREIELSTNGLEVEPETPNSDIYFTKGFASKLSYLSNPNMAISTKKSGIEEAISIASKSFTVDTNITKSKDSQNWIQSKITDKSYLAQCYMHSDLGVSFPSVAITADNKFILRDIKKMVETKKSTGFLYDWRLTSVASVETDIVYDSSLKVESKAGFINNWLGYGRVIFSNLFEGGTIDEILEQPTTLLSDPKDVDKDSTINARDGGSSFVNDNVHVNYQTSYNHNLIGLANLSKIGVTTSFTSMYVDVKPLDVIMFKKPDLEKNEASDEIISGLYIVTGVVRTVQNGITSTTLLLNKEAFNKIKKI